MATYIVIGEETYETNTDAEVAAARAALADAGLECADEFAGVPDGLGDSFKNGNRLFAVAPSSARTVDVGDKVEGGHGEDHDTGRVESIDGDVAYVAWDSGVKTTAPIARLTVIG